MALTLTRDARHLLRASLGDGDSAGGAPDISGFSSVPQAVWHGLADQLRDAGFSEYAQRASQQQRNHDRLQWPLQRWRAREEHTAAAAAYRLFGLGDELGEDAARSLLGAGIFEHLLRCGLLVSRGSSNVKSVLACRPFMDFLVLCDDLIHQGDSVFGVGYGNLAFRALQGRDADLALDVGCGAGATALWLTRHARRVVATDINPRACAILRVNAAMNRVDTIEVRLGDLFEPVKGETFGLVACQLPFVPMAPTATEATYRFGGPVGNELVLRFLSQLTNHLTSRGRAVVVFEQAVTGADVGAYELPPVDDEARTLTLLGAEVDADSYCIRHAAMELRRSVGEFDHVVIELRQHLASLGIRGIRPAVRIVERALDSAGWHDVLSTGRGLWDELSAPTVDRLFAGIESLRARALMGATPRPRIPQGTLLVRPIDQPEGSGCVHLGLPPGHLCSSLELDAKEWSILDAMRGGDAVECPAALWTKLARTGLLDG